MSQVSLSEPSPVSGDPNATQSRTRFPVGVLPGEGIGPEVIQQALRVLDILRPHLPIQFDVITGGEIGNQAVEKQGRALTEEVEQLCEDIFARRGAILCGPGGGRFVYDLRERFQLFVKKTPIQTLPAIASALGKPPVDLLVVRENCGGLYYSDQGLQNGRAIHSMTYTRHEVSRLLEVALTCATRRTRRLTLVVKPGGMPSLSELWIRELQRMAPAAQVATDVLEVDNACYQIIQSPQSFDVIVAPNLFGDILSDIAAVHLGSRGFSYSGNFQAGQGAVYQTGHGAAYDLAGKNQANPIGQIFSVAMMLQESFGLDQAATLICEATNQVLATGARTADFGQHHVAPIDTIEMGTRICECLRERLAQQAATPRNPALRKLDSHTHVSRKGASPWSGTNMPNRAHAIRNPWRSREILAHVHDCSSQVLEHKLHMARAIQSQWRMSPLSERLTRLNRFQTWLREQVGQLQRMMASHLGKPLSDAAEELGRALHHCQSASQLVAGLDDHMCHGLPAPGDCSTEVQVRYQPHGCVAIITPWNNPVAIPVAKIAAASLLGNAVAWKPAIEATPIAEFLLQGWEQSGVPSDLITLCPGGPEVARALLLHRHIDAVSFTGNISNGQSVQRLATQRSIPFQCEMGGNNGVIVWQDADLPRVATQIVRAAFSYAGQRCTAVRRVLVESSVADSFVNHLKHAAGQLRLGDPLQPDTEVGPVVSAAAQQRIEEVLRLAQQQGAEVWRTELPENAGAEDAYRVPPALVFNASWDSPVFQNETFGPVLVVNTVATFEEAIQRLNQVEHGLVAELQTESPRLKQHFLDAAEAGMLKLVSGPLPVHSEAPFAGWKSSGAGPPKHGRWDLDFFARVQAIYHPLRSDGSQDTKPAC